MNFGPVNKDGGWRRLNVLITRARKQCVVFSSIVADDIRVDPGSPRGVWALKRYLKYAEEGVVPPDVEPTGDFDSPFEKGVCEALRDAGWEVHSQIGCAGFSIDLAIVDPDAPGKYLCGIECDGATYHSSATARDRDRLRQAVLEDLGWKIIRIWSTDWFNQPDTTLARLLEQVDGVVSGHAHAVVAEERTPTQMAGGAGVPKTGGSDLKGGEARAASEGLYDGPPPGITPYERFTSRRRRGNRDTLLRASSATLAKLLSDIVGVEGPIHQNELIRVAASLYGLRAMGLAKEKLAEALNKAVKMDLTRRGGVFIWSRSMDRPPIRWRGNEDAVTSAEFICSEEVAEAAAWVVEHEFGIPRDNLPTAAIRAMGFKRIGSQLAELAEQGVRLAIDNRLVVKDANGMMSACPPE